MKYIVSIFIIVAFACHRKMPAESNASVSAPVEESFLQPPLPPAQTVINKESGMPACVQQKADSISKLPVWNPPAEIQEYDYLGKKVYLVSANCCDFFSTAFDENCNYVCAPSGGFTGRGDGLCKDFNDKAKLLRVVWKDERKRSR